MSTRTEERQELDPERTDRQLGLLRLFVGLLFGLGLAAVMGALGGVLVILAVLGMIVLHELGHFATAKWTGMKVTEFFVGFGPRLWSVRKGETEYGVKALPLGGYCKIPGMTMLEEVDPRDEARTYRQQGFLKRLLVATAGSATHFILAFLLLYGGLAFGAILPLNAEPLAEVGLLGELPGGAQTPAQAAGIDVGDRFVAVDGQLVRDWDQVRNYIRERPGEPVAFLIERDGRRRTVTVTPASAPDAQTGEMVGQIGVGPAYETYNALSAVPAAGKEVGEFTVVTLGALGELVTPSGISRYVDQIQGEEVQPDDPRFLSPIGLAQVADTAADSGITTILFLLIAINIFVGMFNMVPLLPLDGGHVAIAAYEAIRSRRGKRYFADVSKLQPVLILTLALLAALALTSLWLDIFRPLQLN